MKQPGNPSLEGGTTATPTGRSIHIWIVIVSTLVMAAYFGWQVMDALLMLTAAGVSKNKLAAYTACSGDDIRWTEEVKLHDGKVIQLKRRTELTSSGFPVQKRGFNKYHEFCYAPMSIHWRSHPKYPPELFDIVNGKAYAKVSVGDCEVCKLHSYPDTDALYFVWEKDAWKKIDHNEFPAQLRLNLLTSPIEVNAANDARGLISLAEKENRDATIYYSLKATGARGLNELPARKGMCNKCKAVNVMTTEIPDVFLENRTRDCG